ncbi:MAG: translation elongation factor Ts [Elusimicrobia bacterium RIFCSPLOWO2_01_FULL_54_10]|nr:MAG: translation elongation factor Ts [Elusimicrobia bacterium RIFCSPLOWO2_01_FULL_54_10]
MATITAQQVQKLRETSGAGMMDCKNALVEANGDFDKAIQLLREKGKASAAKKAGRTTSQGLVSAWISPDGSKAGVVEINCETDFVARTKDFLDFAQNLARLAAEKTVSSADKLLAEKLGAETVEQTLKGVIGKLGENIQVRKSFTLGGNGGKGVIENYVHAPVEKAPLCGSLAVILQVAADKNSDDVKSLARELCMQVAAANPKWISKEDVPADIVAKEKEIYKEQCRQSGKPEQAWGKITEGKLNDFYKQFCLLEQSYIRDSKTPINSLLKQASDKAGAPLAVKGFVRLKMGEE